MADALAASGRGSWRDAAFMDPVIQAGLKRIGVGLETGLTVVCLLLFSGVLLAFFEVTVTADEQPILRLLWYPIYLFVLIGVLLRPATMATMAAVNVLALLPVGLAILSAQWSWEPDITFRRTVALSFTVLFGLYLAARYSWRDLLTMLAVVFGVLAVGSYVMALTFPARGVMQVEFPGVWQGVFLQKNELGSMMTRGVLVFGAILALYADRRRNVWPWIGLLLCLSLVVISTSKTSLVATLAIGAVMLSITMLRRGAATSVAFLCAAGLGLVLFAGLMVWDVDLFLELLGKDRSLTGRTDIWNALGRSVAERPWLGYGYGVFWRDELGPAWWVREATQWSVPSAHNGWLETALSIGLFGCVLAALYMIAAAMVGAARIWSRPEMLFALPYIVVTAVFSMSESIILQHNNVSWVLFVMAAAKIFAPRESLPDAAPARAPARPGACAPARFGDTVSAPLTLFRVTLRLGAPMIDLSADLAGLAAGLERTRPADGRGRVIMFTSPHGGAGVSTLSREFARMMADRSPRGVWLFDLDLSRNEHFEEFTGAEAQRRYGPIGPALDATLGLDPFWRVTSDAADEGGRETLAALLTLHRVGGTRLLVSRFHPELLDEGQRVHIRAAHAYWERLRDTVELAVIDAPATERSFAGRPLYGEADAVVIVVDDRPEAMREAELLAEAVRERGGLPAGVIVNMAEPGGMRAAQRAG